MKRMDLNLLVSLEALIIERNVTKAARRLNLSQPALSAQLNRLRDVFDDPLLVPGHRGMIPTAKAFELLEPLRAALEQLRSTLDSHKSFAPTSADLVVSIACTDYVEAAVVLPLILALREKAPGVRIAVHRLNPPRLDQQLSDGNVDLAIATPDGSHPHLRTRHLFEETYVLIGREGHPHLENSLSAEGFAELEQLIVSPSGGAFTSPVDAMLGTFGRQRKIVASAASFLVVPEIVAASDLVALVPRRLLQRQLPHLTMIDVPWLSERFTVELVWHDRTHAHPGHQWIRELIYDLMVD
ncbi:LysR family transcriptional regulator [Rhizobium sp. B230/85]|nr:LysR family transcriptional regulator [Rhizobium sp. L58/93]MBO9133774.1 LysR family transcriptional regulator [Rhizobium sp. B209b/85]MBO9167613.1 LysR family transcriptional regulator [Rhizobium sp. L245/93]MBO9183572.1 LysR family transcriptional regulator [Rhizobium sp. E27B/91]QXZ85934.1 LysR family transcriptional regulator [Rhizobium sp. K1/93]QXZ91883.1 LysR family transcriptional regulator [Rhizobium sp. K15/93]QXZ97765.1 LysR family transcriptional regulator [Rhizobium sp. B230/8